MFCNKESLGSQRTNKVEYCQKKSFLQEIFEGFFYDSRHKEASLGNILGSPLVADPPLAVSIQHWIFKFALYGITILEYP